MRIFVAIAVLVVVVALIAVATRPNEKDFDRMLDAAVREKIATTDVDASGDALGTIALVGCKLRPTDCVRLLREALDVKITQSAFTTRVEFEGINRKGACIGAFRKFWCDSGMTD